MSTVENKGIMRRYFEEGWNGGNLAVLDEIVAADYVNHNPFVPGLPAGPEGLKPILAGFRAAFPDLHFDIVGQVAEGDKVVTRWMMRGTHQGEFMGIPATGRMVAAGGVQIERIVDGRIVEHWRQSDDLGLLQQLGVVGQ